MKKKTGKGQEKNTSQKKKTVLSNKHILKILNFRIVSIDGHFVNMPQNP